MPVMRAPLGRVDGRDVDLYVLTNANGLRAKVTTFGAILTAFEAPDRNGRLDDVVLGFDDLAGYLNEHPYFGATVGRVGNRIRNATFELKDKKYVLAANDGAHHLHGGLKGWDKAVWSAEALDTTEGPEVKLQHTSPASDEGYPGAMRATTVYTLTNKNELRVVMQAVTDQTTVVNMVHHTYWNLAGVVGNGKPPSIFDHELRLRASAYTPGDPQVPTGVAKSVLGTPFDFTNGKPVGRDLEAAGGDPIGFDHNFVVDGSPSELREVARLAHPASGRVLTLWGDQPGVQFYSGNFLDGTVVGKGGAKYAARTGLCLETQKFPNAINIPEWRNQMILEPGETYRHTMVHQLTTE